MIAEFTVIPIGKGESLSTYVTECIRIVEKSGLKYQLTPMSTIVEGDPDRVMNVIMSCHHKVRSMSRRVITSIEIDDREGMMNAMDHKVASVNTKLSR